MINDKNDLIKRILRFINVRSNTEIIILLKYFFDFCELYLYLIQTH